MNNLSYEELLQANEELKKQLLFYQKYDLLTGLYRREVFYKKVEELLQECPAEDFNIICVNVERFKLVNDLYGSVTGDELLKYLAFEMKEKLSRWQSVLSRIAADIFMACVPAAIPLDIIEKTVISIFKGFPMQMEIVPAIGFYPVNDKGIPVELMCDRAMLAMNSIKGNYLQHSSVYDDSLRSSLLEEQEILNGADTALYNKEFQVFMQPKCSMKTGKIVGALVRWIHPKKGIIPPGVFVPVFEKNGFIKKMDLYVWEETVKWIHEWEAKGNKPVPISVNMSRIDILGIDVYEVLLGILKKYNVDRSYLELEITESAYTSQTADIITTIEQLMNAGFTVLMDDFGSGYSSLNMLKDISINILKLDLHFLDNTNKKSRDILESIVHMTKWLGLRVIAEGVENESQKNFLLNIGCEYAQGYYYYKPMGLEGFESLLRNADKVDYADHQLIPVGWDQMIELKELFHNDVMTDQMLNNILGGVALYEYLDGKMCILRSNEEYLRIVYRGVQSLSCAGFNVMEAVLEEDHPKLKAALEEAERQEDMGAEVDVRRRLTDGGIIWLRLRLFYLSDINGRSIYYAGIADVTDQMEAMEQLKISEQWFRIAMEATANTLFELDIPTRVARYARHSQEEFGLVDCVANAPEGFIEQGSVCPGYEDIFRGIYDAIYRGEDRASCVIKAHMGDDRVVWNRITLIAVKDKNGKSVKAIGLVENIPHETDPKQFTEDDREQGN